MKKFASCLNCMDGRVQLPTFLWIKGNYKIDYVDVITEAGMDGILANESVNIDSILQKVDISIDTHKANDIFIIGIMIVREIQLMMKHMKNKYAWRHSI